MPTKKALTKCRASGKIRTIVLTRRRDQFGLAPGETSRHASAQEGGHGNNQS